MLSAIIQKEILENIRSTKFTLIVALASVLILTSAFVMIRDFQTRLANYEILRPEKNEPAAIVPPTPLSIFAKGLDETLGRAYEIRFGGQIAVGSKQQSVNTLFRLFTTPDLLYVVKVILSLCALIFGFDRISGEKETGTLRLALANSVGRTTLAFGKWIGGFLSFIVPFLLAMLTALLMMAFSPSIRLTGDDWLKLGALLFASVFYMAIFFSLGLFISAVTRRPSSSLVLSLFVWAFLIFVIPNLGNIIARQIIDMPSVQQLELRRQQIWIREVFNRIHGRIPPEQAESAINRENDLLAGEYRERFLKLVSLSKSITRISPAAAYTYLASDLAGTGIEEENRVKTAVLAYKNSLWNRPTDSDGNLIGDFPVFSYERSSLRETLNAQSLMHALILVLFTFLFFSASYVAFLKYDVR